MNVSRIRVQMMLFVLIQLVATIVNVNQVTSEIRLQCAHQSKMDVKIHFIALVVNQWLVRQAIDVKAVDV